MTFAFRLQPSGSASSYRRPVLDARGTLEGPADHCKSLKNATSRYLRKVQFSTFPQRFSRPDTAWDGPKKRIWRLGTRRHLCARSFAEPVSLSSTDPGDFRLPATALRNSFNLLAFRARRRGDTTAGPPEMQGPRSDNFMLFAKKSVFHISTAIRPTCGQLVDNFASRCGLGREPSG